MGYSQHHDLMWDDFPCENFAAEELFVGFICEALHYSPTTEQTTTEQTTTTTSLTTTRPDRLPVINLLLNSMPFRGSYM